MNAAWRGWSSDSSRNARYNCVDRPVVKQDRCGRRRRRLDTKNRNSSVMWSRCIDLGVQTITRLLTVRHLEFRINERSSKLWSHNICNDLSWSLCCSLVAAVVVAHWVMVDCSSRSIACANLWYSRAKQYIVCSAASMRVSVCRKKNRKTADH